MNTHMDATKQTSVSRKQKCVSVNHTSVSRKQQHVSRKQTSVSRKKSPVPRKARGLNLDDDALEVDQHPLLRVVPLDRGRLLESEITRKWSNRRQSLHK